MWPGNYIDRVDGKPTGWPAQELVNQIDLTRSQLGATGNVFFSMRSLMVGHDSLPEKLASGVYAAKALVPASPWLDSVPPLSPIVALGRNASGVPTATIQPRGTKQVWLWVVRLHGGTDWTTDIIPAAERSVVITRFDNGGFADAVAVSAVDRTGNESPATVIPIPTPR
jgi:hypothetical protein